MPDDEETRVRQRLSRLFDPVGAARVPPVAPPAPVSDGGRARPGPAASSPPDRLPFPARSPTPPAARSGRDPAEPPSDRARHLGARRPGRPGDVGGVTADRRETGPATTSTADGRAGAAEAEGTGRPASRLPGPGAFDPGRRGVRALAVVAAVVVLVAGVWAWRSRPHAEPVRPVSAVAASDPPPATVGSPGATAQVVVAVAGKVRRPGLVRLPAGARVADALEAAGGALPGVDVALLNPARKVTDGELILVGVAAPPGPAGPVPAGPAAGPAGGAPGGPVNLNTATLAQLDALPGVGPVLAQRILDHRERHGGFRSVSDLRQVEGIGDARYEQLKDLVTV